MSIVEATLFPSNNILSTKIMSRAAMSMLLVKISGHT